MIRAYFGWQRQGKTYCAVKDIARECKGRTVYSNITLNLPGITSVKLNHPMDLIPLEDGMVFIDELSLWMPSDKWTKFPDELKYRFGQVSKTGLDLYYTAQCPEQVYTAIRRLTQESVYHEKFFGVFQQKFYKGIKSKFMGTWWVFRRLKTVGTYYDHKERVFSPWVDNVRLTLAKTARF